MQDVVFKGTTYSNVPAINLPNSNGGTSKFVDVTDTTAVASDVASGKIFHLADGTTSTGTNSGGGGSSGTDTSDATLTSGSQMLSGVTAYSNGTKYTGTIVSRSSSDLTASGATVTVPAGNYAEQASKSIQAGSFTVNPLSITANPSITVGSDGLITSTVSASAYSTVTAVSGYVNGASGSTVTVSGSDTEQLTTKGATTYTPGTSDQTIASGTYLTGTQTISGDSNLVATNIKNGVSIFGVTGTYSGGGASNIVTGTFKGTTTGAAMDVTLNYSGSGYPVAAVIYPKDGVKGNSSFNALVQRYASAMFCVTKAYAATSPEYDKKTRVDEYIILHRYKSSTSSASTCSQTGNQTYIATGVDATSTNINIMNFKSKTKMSVYIASTSYGFAANIDYTYHVIYSS